MPMVLGPLLTVQVLAALAGLDPTVFEPGEGIAIRPSEVRFVAARHHETVIRGRPWVPHKRVATVSRGTRLAVRGEVSSRDAKGCENKPWYAVLPFGYVCSLHVRPTDEAPAMGPAIPVPEGKRLPHAYAVVREDRAPLFADAEQARLGVPTRTLTKNMTLVADRTTNVDGFEYLQLRDGSLVPRQYVGWMGQGSDWQGVGIAGATEGPLLGWASRDGTPVFREPDPGAERVRTIRARDRVFIHESHGAFRRIGDGAWVRADDLNEVVVIPPPEGVLTDLRLRQTGNDQWIDVDVGEQVLVAYRGRDPVYATLVSSGRGSPTPLGNYPVWAKVASMDMANQDYEDKPYMVQGVPWVLLFQGHNALHGAYWHDRFGHRKSHGCVNLSPRDARWIFEWVAPVLPAGWTGYLPYDLHRSPVVHVRDSSKPEALRFTQERPWGPPDFEEERKKSEAAAERRAAAAAWEADIPASPAEAPPPPPRRLTAPPVDSL